MRPAANRALAVVFLLAIGMPLAANLAGVDGADPVAENREMAAFPAFDGSWHSARRYPAGLDAWFDDHFGFRAAFVRWNARASVEWFRTSSSASVFLGRNSWLFYADDGAVEDMGNVAAMPKGEVKNWREALVRAHDWLERRAIAYVFTIVPDKHAAYPEELPDGVRALGPTSRAQQVFSGLAGADFVVDVRDALASAKTRERTYHLTDSHWNDRGLFVAYQALVEAARRQDPSVPPAWPRSDFSDVSKVTDAGDLGGMLGLKRVLREERLLLAPGRPRLARVVEPAGAEPTAEEGRLVTEIPGSTLPRAVIFRDSFMSPMVPFLSEHFSRAVYLWQNDFDANAVLAERPDVVIQEIAGRHLYLFIPSPELVPR